MLLHSTVTCSTDDSSKDESSDDHSRLKIILVTLFGITTIGLVISVVINVFLVVQRKKLRCVLTNIILCS